MAEKNGQQNLLGLEVRSSALESRATPQRQQAANAGGNNNSSMNNTVNQQNNNNSERNANNASKVSHYLTVHPEENKIVDESQRDSYVFQPGLDTIGGPTSANPIAQVTEKDRENPSSASRAQETLENNANNESPTTFKQNAQTRSKEQKSQRSTVLSLIKDAELAGHGSNQQLQNRMGDDSVSHSALRKKESPSKSQQQRHGKHLYSGKPEEEQQSQSDDIDEHSNRQMSAQNVMPMITVDKQLNQQKNHPQTKESKINQNNQVLASQTLFSSYNDSDSNQTLRFNRHVSRMSLTTNVQKDHQSKDQSNNDQVIEKRRDKSKSPKDNNKPPVEIVQKPSQLEVKAVKPNQVAQTQYQPLQGVNLASIGDGPIPLTQQLDETGFHIASNHTAFELQNVQKQISTMKNTIQDFSPKRAREQKHSVTRNPSKFVTSNIASGQISPVETQFGNMGQSEMIKFGTIASQIESTPHAMQHAEEILLDLSRKSPNPFQTGGLNLTPTHPPVVQVINKMQQRKTELLKQPQASPIQRRHQSPPAYNISSLPQHLNKSGSRKQFEQNASPSNKDDQSPKNPRKLNKDSSLGSLPSPSNKRIQLKGDKNSPYQKQQFNILAQDIIQSVFDDDNLQSQEGSADQTQHYHHPTNHSNHHFHSNQIQQQQQQHQQPFTIQSYGDGSRNNNDQQRQFATVALSPMMTGASEVHREGVGNLTGMFSNSSDALSAMINNANLLNQTSNERRRLLKDAATGTMNSRAETFRSLTTEQKTQTRMQTQDILAGAQQDQYLYDQPIILNKRNSQQYRTPIRQRDPNAEKMLLQNQQKLQSASVSKVPSSFRVTLENAAERNMHCKYPEKVKTPSVQGKNVKFIKEMTEANKPKESNYYRPTFSPNSEKRQREVPRSLYYTNGYMPKLSDLRDALRNNEIFHNRYNPELDTPAIRKVYQAAIKLQPGEVKGKVDEEFENQPVLDMCIPSHQDFIDKKRAKIIAEENYWATMATRHQQKKTMDKLISLKVQKRAKYEAIREKEIEQLRAKALTFRAKLNPFRNHDTTEKLEKFFALEERDPKRGALFDFLAEKRFNDITLPTSMFDAEPEQQKRIQKIIAEENRKMQSNDSDGQKFDRLKRQVEELVEQGYTFKQPKHKQVSFAATLKKKKDKKKKRRNRSKNSKSSNGSNSGGSGQENSNNNSMSHRKLSLSPSFGNLSFKSLSMSQRKKTLDPTIVDNDFETPLQTEMRQRPAPDFVPKSQLKPKQILPVRKEDPNSPFKSRSQSTKPAQVQVNRIEIKVPQDQEDSKFFGKDLRHLTMKLQDESRENSQDHSKETEDIELFERAEQLVATQSIRLSTRDLNELRKSRDALRQTPGLVQTHHQALRQSRTQPLEYLKREQDEDMTINVDDQKEQQRAMSDTESGKDTKSLQHHQHSEHAGKEDVMSFGQAKRELQEEVKKSMVRDTSVILQPNQDLLEVKATNAIRINENNEYEIGGDVRDSIMFDDNQPYINTKSDIFGKTNSVQDIQANIGNQSEPRINEEDQAAKESNIDDGNAQQELVNNTLAVKQPFILNAGLSQQLSQQQFTIQPSLLGGSNLTTVVVKGQARENLLREKRVEMLHKPELNKSSCNHCITKAVKKHDKVMEQLAISSAQSCSLAGVAVASTVAGTSQKASAFNYAATEFLSVSPSQGNLPHNFSMSQIPTTTQYESQSNLNSEAIQKKAYEQLAQNAQSAIKGLLAQCDMHGKISKHVNEEFNQEFNKKQKALTIEINDVNKAIETIQDAEDEIPDWQQLHDLQNVARAADESIIADSVAEKHRFDPQAIINIIKMQPISKKWKPSRQRLDPDVQKFLKERFEKKT